MDFTWRVSDCEELVVERKPTPSRALFAPQCRRNFRNRSSHIQEIVWLNADKNADKWIFQKLGNPQTLGIAGGQRWN